MKNRGIDSSILRFLDSSIPRFLRNMFDPKALHDLINEGYLQVQRHPEAEFFIYNYTAKTQYEREWNAITLQCRGLILDGNLEPVARPFKKFFNLGETTGQAIPNEPFEVFEKMDGSLGILYWLHGEAFIATRGSFTSEQAARGTAILRRRYSRLLPSLDKTKTYLFEIIYPENRIVVDYGEMEDLVLLAVVDNQTGKEVTVENPGFTPVRRYHGVRDVHVLKELAEENREGFVVRFESGLRYKIKFDEYVRIHRIITQVSSLSIWEYLKEGQSLDEILDRVPDEFYQWVRKTNEDLHAAFRNVEERARAEFKVLGNRKETALYFQQCTYPALLFAMLDGKDYAPAIWKLIRPDFAKPFADKTDDL